MLSPWSPGLCRWQNLPEELQRPILQYVQQIQMEEGLLTYREVCKEWALFPFDKIAARGANMFRIFKIFRKKTRFLRFDLTQMELCSGRKQFPRQLKMALASSACSRLQKLCVGSIHEASSKELPRILAAHKGLRDIQLGSEYPSVWPEHNKWCAGPLLFSPLLDGGFDRLEQLRVFSRPWGGNYRLGNVLDLLVKMPKLTTLFLQGVGRVYLSGAALEGTVDVTIKPWGGTDVYVHRRGGGVVEWTIDGPTLKCTMEDLMAARQLVAHQHTYTSRTLLD